MCVEVCVCFLELATCCSGPVLKLYMGTIKWLLSVNLFRKWYFHVGHFTHGKQKNGDEG